MTGRRGTQTAIRSLPDCGIVTLKQSTGKDRKRYLAILRAEQKLAKELSTLDRIAAIPHTIAAPRLVKRG